MNKQTLLIHFLFLPIFWIIFASPNIANAEYQKVSLGDTIRIGEFVYNDDYTPSVTACTITINDPVGTLKVNAGAMTTIATGWHYYDYAVGGGESTGSWSTAMSCGSGGGGDLIVVDKTFVVVPTVASLNNDIASSVWGSGTRSLTTFGSLVSDVWGNTTRSLTTFGTLVADIWGSTTRSLTTFGTLVADVWGNTTRTLTSLGGTVESDVTAIKAKTDTLDWTDVTAIKGNVATLITEVGTGNITGIKTKTDTIAWGNVTGLVTTAGDIKAKTDTLAWADVTGIKTKTDTIAWADVTGIKTKTDTIAWGDIGTLGTTAAAIQAKTDTINWADIASIPLNTWGYSARSLTTFGTLVADVWNYSVRSLTTSAPPQVIITSMEDLTVPNITANVRITNEGFTGFEYYYEWCVVTNLSNDCGGGDDTYYSSASKLINPGENFDTILSSTVVAPGSYYFKVAVNYGTEKSGASRSFVAISSTPGGGGGGGGGGGDGTTNFPPVNNGARNVADFSGDGKVNSVDFSILLAFWKTNPPFSNPNVDINKDLKVNSVDFSILLSQWGKVGAVSN
ncbi:MAG: dockerin type I domain-containing protein [Candidatus Paceibacterota bacterium]